jgi:hypothetical protein
MKRYFLKYFVSYRVIEVCTGRAPNHSTAWAVTLLVITNLPISDSTFSQLLYSASFLKTKRKVLHATKKENILWRFSTSNGTYIYDFAGLLTSRWYHSTKSLHPNFSEMSSVFNLL